MAIFDDLPGILSDTLAELDANEGLGVTVTFTHRTAGAYNPATGSTGSGTSTTETAIAVVADVRGKELVDGLILAGDKKLTIAGPDLSTEPKPASSTVSIDGVGYTVLTVKKTQPGADVALWSIFCGRR